jgi:7-cyano-7-deazaguanine synthase
LNNKSLVILTGGIESTTILALALHNNEEVVVIEHYGGFRAEAAAIEQITAHYNTPVRVSVDISSALALARTVSSDNTVSPIIDPLLMASAAYFAQLFGCNKIYTGYEGEQVGQEFATFCQQYPLLIKDFLPGAPTISYASPFVGKKKSEVISIGQRLGVPYEWTYSCAKDQDKHCGQCTNCQKRMKAFADAGVADPTVYESHH